MLKLTDQLLIVADAYRHAKGLSRGRVSTIVFAQGRVLDRVAEGREITTGRFERAMQWFAENWPDNAEWPPEVPRHLYEGSTSKPPFMVPARAA